MEHKRLSTDRAKAVTSELNQLLIKLRPHPLTLIEGFGVPVQTLGTNLLEEPPFASYTVGRVIWGRRGPCPRR